MSIITILHISDLHWSHQKANDQKIVIVALLNDLKLLNSREGLKPDLIVFSGDLVHSGSAYQDFEAADRDFVMPVLSVTSLPRDKFFIVPGNHDIDRQTVEDEEYIEAGLKTTLTRVDVVNDFIDRYNSGDGTRKAAFRRLTNFDKYDTFLSTSKHIISNTSLLRTFKVIISDLSLGVACFNTAWRATGAPNDADRLQLILGERSVDQAYSDLNDVDIRIGVFHHPVNWLADFDRIAVFNRLMSNFAILLNGHIHSSFPELRQTTAGTSVISQAGCLYQNRDYFNGYQFIKMDTDNHTVEFIIRTYFNSRPAFDAALNIGERGRQLFITPTTAKNSIDNEISHLLQSMGSIIRRSAIEHFNFDESTTNINVDPKSAFVCPPLTLTRRRLSENEFAADTRQSGADHESVGSILNSCNNFIIFGPREAGKSSLAHYMALLCADGTCDYLRLPVILDFKRLKRNAYGLRKACGAYYASAELKFDIQRLLSDGRFLFLVDNFSCEELRAKEEFAALVGEFPGNRWFCFYNTHVAGLDLEEKDFSHFEEFKKVQIQPLPRKSIRELAKRWCDRTGTDYEKTFDTVWNQLHSANLPRTGYIVTLLLWAVYQEKKF